MTKINSRTKGNSAEREIINLFQPIVNEVCLLKEIPTIELVRNTLQWASGGCDVHGLDWWAPEVKRCETLLLDKWWEQAERQAKLKCAEPALIYRKSRMPWRCRFMALIKIPILVEIESEIKLWHGVIKSPSDLIRNAADRLEKDSPPIPDYCSRNYQRILVDVSLDVYQYYFRHRLIAELKALDSR